MQTFTNLFLQFEEKLRSVFWSLINSLLLIQCEKNDYIFEKIMIGYKMYIEQYLLSASLIWDQVQQI